MFQIEGKRLEALGFEVLEREDNRSLSIAEVYVSPYSKLYSFPAFGFKFVHHANQRMKAIRDEKEFFVFGSCHAGYILIDTSGLVFVVDIDNGKIVHTASDLNVFGDVYTYLIICILKLSNDELSGDVSDEELSRNLARDFREYATKKDSEVDFESTIWGEYYQLFKDNSIGTRPPLPYFFESGSIDPADPNPSS